MMEERLKIYTIGKRMVHLLFQPGAVVRVPNGDGSFTTVRLMADAPPDAKVRGIHQDWCRQAFGVVMEHESFPLVQDGNEIPWATNCSELEYHEPEPVEIVTEAK